MNQQTPVLRIQGLHKEYGRITAVDHLDLEIEKGSVFGLLGPNGSGKSTTLGMVMEVVNPSGGTYSWFGEVPHHSQRKRIGAILEKPNFYPRFSAIKNLQLVCKIKGVNESRIPEVLQLVGLAARQKDPFQNYSLGMKQRLAIASALLAEPEVLILDEPTNGLDPQGIAEIRQLIIDISQSGKTIILASHLLDEVQKVCDRFAILRQGKLIHIGRVDEGFGEEVIIEVSSGDLNALDKSIALFPGFISQKALKDRLEVKCAQGTDPSALSKFLAEKEIYLSHIVVHRKNLEQQFMEILSNNG